MKKTIIIVVIVINAVLLAGYAGYRGYKVWKQGHMLELAKGFLDKSDYRNAVLSLQQVLRANPRNLEACRLMAQLAETERNRNAAIMYRTRVVEANPGSTEDRIALAQTSMMFQDYGSATNALEGVSVEGKKTAAYHNIAGAVALAGRQLQEAENHFIEAARLEPTNAVPQLNLAVLRLHNTNSTVAVQARESLQKIATDHANPGLQCQAIRELIGDAVRHAQTNNALALSKQLVAQTNSTSSDRILRLDVLNGYSNPEFQPTLAAYKRDVGTNMGRIYELGMWQMSKLGPAEAVNWLTTFPQDIQTNQPVTLMLAECRLLTLDYKTVSDTIGKQNWAELEFLRHALMTRALRGQDLAAAAKAEWEQALKAANNNKTPLTMLLRVAAQWKWLTEAEEILWSIVNRYPEERWAFQTLSQALYENGRTRPLMNLFSQQYKRTPEDLSLKNNLAVTALLLDAKELKPHELAQDVYTKAPTNASFASTYAFSLHMQAKNDEALKIMEALKPKELEHPSIAGYYGLILSAKGNAAKAKTYFDLVGKAPLLPEEKKIFDRARSGT